MICAAYLLALADDERERASFFRSHGLRTLSRQHVRAQVQAEKMWAYATGL